MIENAHTLSSDAALHQINSRRSGLTPDEAHARLRRFGPNQLPAARSPGLLRVFLHQFTSPLIYVLLAAAGVSLLIQEYSDAGFIAVVLAVNAVVGAAQEYSAQRAADALRRLVSARARVLRDGQAYEIDATGLVPGDVVMLESGDRVPADLRLLESRNMEADESLLTGESLTVLKNAGDGLPAESALGDRVNMAFAGTLVARGRGVGVATATALHTQLGRIAEAALGESGVKSPLLTRMEIFTRRIAALVGVCALFTGIICFWRGMPLDEVFLLTVALAVSAIPEGLPVALTVALSIGMRRMAKRHVIVRRLLAVEALGSCTYIAADKTGTLTENRLSVVKLALPGGEEWEVGGEARKPVGDITTPAGAPREFELRSLRRLCMAAALANEGFLGRRDGDWTSSGDAADVAMLVMAGKAGVARAEALQTSPELASIPFESERQFSASLNRVDGRIRVSAKGALEKILPMCDSMATLTGDAPIDASQADQQARRLAAQGYRVIALADGEMDGPPPAQFDEAGLRKMTLLGLVCLIDPLRAEARDAVAACKRAGMEVAMVTGDHPMTAHAIGARLGLAQDPADVVTGPQLRQADEHARGELIRRARVFARMEPRQKTDVVRALQAQGHFVAVTGDGVNDAPALRSAQVGVAMGKSGTDVVRETAELIITDDNFSSIVAGVEEGRIAYANVRKVVFLLISTGAAELVLFALSLLSGLPLPLLAVQLLWLNLVTNGIQDVALAFEPGEGDELRRPPRRPNERIFNRLMIERVLISALVMGGTAFLLFRALLESGMDVDSARNSVLLLMVLFENVHAFNSRSETRSVFRHNPLRNRLLLAGTLAAQLIHIGAMHTPWIGDVLHLHPVSPALWAELLGMALVMLLMMEIHKLVKSRFPVRD